MKITKEWFEKAAAREGDHEIGAGRLPTYIPGFVPSEADRYYNAVIAGLHSRIAELESALSVPAAAVVGEPVAWYREGFTFNFSLGSQRPKNNTSNPDEWTPLYAAASRISQQDAELERLWREVEELRDAKWQAKHVDTMNDIASLRIALEGAEAALAEARKAAFIEVAEMAVLSSSPSVYAFAAMIRAKAEETRI